MTSIDPSTIETASLSDTGRVRSENQDAWGEFRSADGARLLVVADGLGGHAGGRVASRTAVATIGETFEAGDDSPECVLRRGFRAANERVHRLGVERWPLVGTGTTAVAVALHREGAWVAHVGDSRAYRWRDGCLELLTEDHSWVSEQVRQGRMTPEEARTDPQRNALLRSIGHAPDVEVDLARLEPRAGDRLLLCSDGLWGELDEAVLAELLGRLAPGPCVEALVARANLAGGHDNVTATVAHLA